MQAVLGSPSQESSEDHGRVTASCPGLIFVDFEPTVWGKLGRREIDVRFLKPVALMSRVLTCPHVRGKGSRPEGGQKPPFDSEDERSLWQVLTGQGRRHGYPKGCQDMADASPKKIGQDGPSDSVLHLSQITCGQRARKVTHLPKITQRVGQEPGLLVLLLEAPAMFR